MARVPSLPAVRRRLGRVALKAAHRLDPSSAPPAVRPWVAPGHFYSPIPSWSELQPRSDALFGAAPDQLPDVDLNPRQQLDCLAEFEPLRADRLYAPGDARTVRYHSDNRMFGAKSANALHFMLRRLAPKRVVEVGSGFSSAVMLDTDQHFFGNSLELTFIEPYPERLFGRMSAEDRGRCEVIQSPLQAAPRAAFEALQAGDVVFVDSSHVLKTGSDLCTFFFEIMPSLRAGVYVHFHDILYPFEYPQTWVEQGRAWNEAYALRALLANSRAYALEFWASYLFRCHRQALQQVPEVDADGSSIWIRKLT